MELCIVELGQTDFTHSYLYNIHCTLAISEKHFLIWILFFWNEYLIWNLFMRKFPNSCALCIDSARLTTWGWNETPSGHMCVSRCHAWRKLANSFGKQLMKFDRLHLLFCICSPFSSEKTKFQYQWVQQRYTYRVLQTIQIELIILCVWAEPAVLGSAKTALKFKYEI